MQVNTDPMISVTGHLDVVVPPTISDEDSSSSEVKQQVFTRAVYVIVICECISSFYICIDLFLHV